MKVSLASNEPSAETRIEGTRQAKEEIIITIQTKDKKINEKLH